MGQWNFYFSGILYGKIRESEEGLQVQKWLPESGSWNDWVSFEDKEDREFAGLCKRSVLHFSKTKWNMRR